MSDRFIIVSVIFEMGQPVPVMILVWKKKIVFMQADGTIISTTDKLLSVCTSFSHRCWEFADLIDLRQFS